MKESMSLIFQTLKIFILFISFTVLFYMGMVWLNQEYKDYHRYEEPSGASIKVTTADEPEKETWFSRFMLFYLNGE